jgi:hypothetical protein
MAVPRGLSPRALPLIGAAMLGLATAGCQSLAVPTDDPWTYDSGSPQNVAMSPSCSAPSWWCVPYSSSPYWSRPVPGYPYYGWGARRPRRGSPGYYSWGHPGRYRHGGFRSGGFRSGGGRR